MVLQVTNFFTKFINSWKARLLPKVFKKLLGCFLTYLTFFIDVVLLSIHLLINLMSKNFTEFILSHCDFEIEQLLSNYLHEIDSMPNSALQGLHFISIDTLIIFLHTECKLILIRESWKKIQNAGPSPSAFSGKKIQSAALNHFVYVPMFWNFFRRSRSVMVPKING